MAKPATFDGYSDRYAVDCERVLVTLLRGLGPWKESVFLVGGLTPGYLVAARPPEVPAHAGTPDVDIVTDLQILADTAGHRSACGGNPSRAASSVPTGGTVAWMEKGKQPKQGRRPSRAGEVGAEIAADHGDL